jgi:ABC-type antimicrobial peptide transport system permease subunit
MISFDPKIYTYGFLLGFATSSIASYLPAKAASRLMPIEIIRGGAE